MLLVLLDQKMGESWWKRMDPVYNYKLQTQRTQTNSRRLVFFKPDFLFTVTNKQKKILLLNQTKVY